MLDAHYRTEHQNLAAVSIISGMRLIPLPDWPWGWGNRFYRIGVDLSVVGQFVNNLELEGGGE